MAKIKGWRKVEHLQIVSNIPCAQHQWVHERFRYRITIYPLKVTTAKPVSKDKFVVVDINNTLLSGVAGVGMTTAIKIARNYMRKHPKGVR